MSRTRTVPAHGPSSPDSAASRAMARLSCGPALRLGPPSAANTNHSTSSVIGWRRADTARGLPSASTICQEHSRVWVIRSIATSGR